MKPKLLRLSLTVWQKVAPLFQKEAIQDSTECQFSTGSLTHPLSSESPAPSSVPGSVALCWSRMVLLSSCQPWAPWTGSQPAAGARPAGAAENVFLFFQRTVRVFVAWIKQDCSRAVSSESTADKGRMDTLSYITQEKGQNGWR